MSYRMKFVMLQWAFAGLVGFNVWTKFWPGAATIFSFQIFYLLLHIYLELAKRGVAPSSTEAKS